MLSSPRGAPLGRLPVPLRVRLDDSTTQPVVDLVGHEQQDGPDSLGGVVGECEVGQDLTDHPRGL